MRSGNTERFLPRHSVARHEDRAAFWSPTMTITRPFHGRVFDLSANLARLLDSTPMRFDSSLRRLLPEGHGVYRIFLGSAPTETLRAGRTKTAAAGLRQRVYQNHFMGDQKGNLRQQLISAEICRDLLGAKEFIRSNCLVQVFEIEQEYDRMWTEHFILSVLRPRFTN